MGQARLVLPFGPIVLGRPLASSCRRNSLPGLGEGSSVGDLRALESFRPSCRVVVFFGDCEACHILV